MTTSPNERFDVYSAITASIITAIEAGSGDNVQLPWHRNGGSIQRPTNILSKKAYRGVNTVALWAAADACGFAHGIWGTYRQWQEKGAQVRKGEKSSVIIFYRDLDPSESASCGNDDEQQSQKDLADHFWVTCGPK